MKVTIEERLRLPRLRRHRVLLDVAEHADRGLPEHPAVGVVAGHHSHANAEVAISGIVLYFICICFWAVENGEYIDKLFKMFIIKIVKRDSTRNVKNSRSQRKLGNGSV